MIRIRAVSEGILDHAKCIKQLAQTVEMNVKSHSNLQKASRFTAENVMLNIENININ